jgi:hypothetical protein
MKEHFETQLATAEGITESDIGLLKGRGIYSPYKVGDKVLFFMSEEETTAAESQIPFATERFEVKTCTERDFTELAEDYEYVRMGGTGTLPVFKKRIRDKRGFVGFCCDTNNPYDDTCENECLSWKSCYDKLAPADMKEHFKVQLASETKTALTMKDIDMLSSSPLYGPYKPGDKMLAFMYQENVPDLEMKICVERDFDQMEKDYEFVRMDGHNFPVLKKKPEEIQPNWHESIG